MKKNFKDSLDHVLDHEGGWADHPKDPGGATMKGVTLAPYRRHFGSQINPQFTLAVIFPLRSANSPAIQSGKLASSKFGNV